MFSFLLVEQVAHSICLFRKSLDPAFFLLQVVCCQSSMLVDLDHP